MADEHDEHLDQLTGDDFDVEDDFAGEQPEEVEVGGERTFFCGMRLYPIVHDPFVAGAKFTIGGVFDSEFDESKGFVQLDFEKEFSGRKGGKGVTLKNSVKKFIFVTEHVRSEEQGGGTYQRNLEIKAYRERCLNKRCKGKGKIGETICPDCDGIGTQPSVWYNHQWPSLKEMGQGRQALIDAAKDSLLAWSQGNQDNAIWCWVKATQGEADFERSFDGKDGKMVTFSPKYWTEIEVYSDKVTWQAASDAYWAERGGLADSNVIPKSDLPARWAESNNTIEGSFSSMKEKDYSHKGFAQALALIDRQGKPMEKANGQPCDPKEIISRLVGLPVDLLEWN